MRRPVLVAARRRRVWWQPVVGGLVVGMLGLVRARRARRRLRPRRRGAQRQAGARHDGGAARAEAGRHGHLLRLGQRGRHLRAQPVHRRDARRRRSAAWRTPGCPTSPAAPAPTPWSGMGTAFAGIVRTPMTSVIMIFEITRDYSIIVPVMIANLISYFISRAAAARSPIYEALLHQDGIQLPPARGPSARVTVAHAMRPAAEAGGGRHRRTPPGGGPPAETRPDAWPVVDGRALVGMVTVRVAGGRASGREAATPADVVGPGRGPLRPSLPARPRGPTLDVVLRRMGRRASTCCRW